jgi:hypothetical protein
MSGHDPGNMLQASCLNHRAGAGAKQPASIPSEIGEAEHLLRILHLNLHQKGDSGALTEQWRAVRKLQKGLEIPNKVGVF